MQIIFEVTQAHIDEERPPHWHTYRYWPNAIERVIQPMLKPNVVMWGGGGKFFLVIPGENPKGYEVIPDDVPVSHKLNLYGKDRELLPLIPFKTTANIPDKYLLEI
jgi:hypothetical protein